MRSLRGDQHARPASLGWSRHPRHRPADYPRQACVEVLSSIQRQREKVWAARAIRAALTPRAVDVPAPLPDNRADAKQTRQNSRPGLEDHSGRSGSVRRAVGFRFRSVAGGRKAGGAARAVMQE